MPWMRGRPRSGLAGATVTILTPRRGRRARRHQQQLARVSSTCRTGRVGLRVEPVEQRSLERSAASAKGKRATSSGPTIGDALTAARSRGPADRAGRARSGARRCGTRCPRPRSRRPRARPPRPSRVTRPMNSVPTIESWRSTRDESMRPSAASSASRARGARAAGRAIHLAVGEDRDVALVRPVVAARRAPRR